MARAEPKPYPKSLRTDNFAIFIFMFSDKQHDTINVIKQVVGFVNIVLSEQNVGPMASKYNIR